MKQKFICGLMFASLAIGLIGCSTSSPPGEFPSGASISPKAKLILKRMADYYQALDSFEGTNVISDESPSGQYPGMRREKRFAFTRPNQFVIASQGTNDSQWFCDGKRFWIYKPYYFNSYTVTPAPLHFSDAVTNWFGGELVRLIAGANVNEGLVKRFGDGLQSLRHDGEETVSGIACEHVVMELKDSKTAEFWINKGGSPFIVKHSLRFPHSTATNGFLVHTETIVGWKAGRQIPISDFAFVPPAGSVEKPVGADQIRMTLDVNSGEWKIEFYAPDAD